MKKVLVVISSIVGGAAVVVAGIRVSFLNWVVHIPGLLARQVLPINLHEGEGAFGFSVDHIAELAFVEHCGLFCGSPSPANTGQVSLLRFYISVGKARFRWISR